MLNKLVNFNGFWKYWSDFTRSMPITGKNLKETTPRHEMKWSVYFKNSTIY